MSQHQTCLQLASHVLPLLEFVATNIFLFILSTLSRQDFFESLTIYVATGNSLAGTDFSSLILVACCCLSRHRNLYCDMLDLANLSSPSISVAT